MCVLKFNYNGSERNYFACPINFSCYIRLEIFKTIILRKNRKRTDIVCEPYPPQSVIVHYWLGQRQAPIFYYPVLNSVRERCSRKSALLLTLSQAELSNSLLNSLLQLLTKAEEIEEVAKETKRGGA